MRVDNPAEVRTEQVDNSHAHQVTSIHLAFCFFSAALVLDLMTTLFAILFQILAHLGNEPCVFNQIYSIDGKVDQLENHPCSES